jgi:O-acetyl-ADP-ribose deacetylase (regulator of RNase III)
LKRAYQESLNRAYENELHTVGFSLLSAGVYRAKVPLTIIFELSVQAIMEWTPASNTYLRDAQDSETKVMEVTLCAFTENECDTLQSVCDDLLMNFWP